MASSERERGNPIDVDGQRVAANVKRFRTAQGLSLREVSDALAEVRPISPSGLSKIENASRKVDADDLVALAVVLNVNPNALLLPEGAESFEETAILGAGLVPSDKVWDWALGRRAIVYSKRLGSLLGRTDDAGKRLDGGTEAGRQIFALQQLEDEEFRDRVLPEGLQ